jgi:hypothetical protein
MGYAAHMWPPKNIYISVASPEENTRGPARKLEDNIKMDLNEGSLVVEWMNCKYDNELQGSIKGGKIYWSAEQVQY